jgi:adenine-specific DNA-methyltransferase
MSKTYGDNIILDFFAGSATTAHAIFELNREDSSKRKFICVQLPEPTTEDSEAFKLGYKNIAEIGKERIRRVIKKIRDESKQQKIESKKQDLGFKVFKLDKSNFKVWDMSSQDSVQSKLSEHVETVEKGSSTEDLLYELILKDGLELTEEIKTLSLSGKKVHSIMDNTMLVCLEKEITLELVKEMAKLKPSRIICLDEGFRQNDQLKTNAVKIFKQANDQVVFRTV